LELKKEAQYVVKAAWILLGVLVGTTAVIAGDTMADTELGARPPGPEALAAMRARGPAGLVEALQTYDVLQAEHAQRMFSCALPPQPSSDNDTALAAWSKAVDQIGGQRGCTVSRLYWYTDLAQAKAAAEQSQRPILSLRMLGKLTDEFSCANSRFFRTALYSNKEISDYLRDNFVLHWQSVRPVPRVTIDFGDGRKLERTLTGNSAHYVLASDGTPLDALPGLYGPNAFLDWLKSMQSLDKSYRWASQAQAEPKVAHAQILKRYHQNRGDAILKAWDQDLQRLDAQQEKQVSSKITGAIKAARLAGQPVPNDEELWQAVAKLHRTDVHLDESSVAVMRQEFPKAAIAARLTETKARVEDPVLRLVRTFEDSMSLDAVRNEYLLHRRIHKLLAGTETGAMDFDALNEWVYAELFLTPSKDPWLGLAPSDIYTALDRDGHVEQTVQAASPPAG
jgi:hypothetical protein